MTEQKAWRCFHCDEVFTDPAEARQHFGSRRFADVPACQLTPEDVRELRALETANERLRCKNEELDDTARLYHEQCAEIKRLIGDRSLFMELDYRNGEKIVLEARATRLASALQSIANNSCCGGCREAALVAQSALVGSDAC